LIGFSALGNPLAPTRPFHHGRDPTYLIAAGCKPS
jgi:hypothetical protein